MSKAYELQSLKAMGINVAKLGCVMLDVEMPDFSHVIPSEYEYYSPSEDNWWVTGTQKQGHVTLLYGLIPRLVNRDAVDEVLKDWNWNHHVVGHDIEAFPSPFPSEPYSCIVARVDNPFLADAHARLSLLPHINTYPEFKPHVTIAYVKEKHKNEMMGELRKHFPIGFLPTGLNYGHLIG